ncbi:hypothetical protein K438DRAFT_1982180 [Mycena galopus ATCC 62051]|nr:hypothetical protein K438DRAFT_1982180 [Mycena galopus ATCC 62051]
MWRITQAWRHIGSTRRSSFIHIGYDLQGPEFSVNGIFRLTSGIRFLPFSLFAFRVGMGEFDQTIGFTLIGVTINTYLTGVIISQFFTYWNSSYQDPRWIKTIVACLFIINITQAAAVVYMSWFYCVTNFANPRVVAISLWPYPFSYLTTAVLAITNQMFQLWRIYLFTGSRIRVGFLVVTSLAACGTGVAAAIKSWVFSELAKLAVLQPIVEVNLALQCALDVILTGELYLLPVTFDLQFTSTDKVFNRLIRTAVQSGFFTCGYSGPSNERCNELKRVRNSAVFALGNLFSFRFAPSTYMVALFALPIGRIYTHTMMDHLISREPLRNSLSTHGFIPTVPNFHAPGEESICAADGTATLLRNVSTSVNTIKANETV